MDLPHTNARHDDLSYDEEAVVNPSANAHLGELIGTRMPRRTALKGGVGLAASMLLGTTLPACGGGGDDSSTAAVTALSLGFAAVAKNRNDIVTVPTGYHVAVLHAMGYPLH